MFQEKNLERKKNVRNIYFWNESPNKALCGHVLTIIREIMV